MRIQTFDPSLWGPSYWMVLKTSVLLYPEHSVPAVTKKRYYEWFTNFWLFLPTEESAKTYELFLHTHPISPYLDSQADLWKWVCNLHNYYNKMHKKSCWSYHESKEYIINYYNQPTSLIAKSKVANEIYCILLIFLVIWFFFTILCLIFIPSYILKLCIHD